MDRKTCTRAEWGAYVADRQERTGTHGFDPGMPWHVANWRERLGIAVFYSLMWGGVFPAMIIGALLLLGRFDDANVAYHIQHDRCLKQATNGYEIQKCH